MKQLFLLLIATRCAVASQTAILPVISGEVSILNQGRVMQAKYSLVLQEYKDYSSYYYWLLCPDENKPNGLGVVFSLHPLRNWSFISNGTPNEAFLAWQDEFLICIFKLASPLIPKAIDPFGARSPSSWQADYLINLKDYEKWENAITNSDESELIATAITTIRDSLTVTATNKHGEQLKFLKSQDGWHAFAGTNEIRRIKLSSIDWSVLEERGFWPVYFTNTLIFKTATGTLVTKDVALRPKQLGRLWSYQLYEMTNMENKLSRLICEIMVAPINQFGHFTIVENRKGNGYYLCWTDLQGRLCLSGITNRWPEAKYVEDPNVGPFSYPKDDPFMRGGVDHIIDLRQFDNYQRFFKDGGGVASAIQENNVLTLTVTNVAGSKFTFSNQDGQWHAYSFWGEINRVKK